MLFVLIIVKLATANLDGYLLGGLGSWDMKFDISAVVVILVAFGI